MVRVVTLRTLLLLVCASLLSAFGWGCAVRVPDGRFRCGSGEACPPGQICVEGICRSGRDGGNGEMDAFVDGALDARQDVADAPLTDVSSVDASSDAYDEQPDAFEPCIEPHAFSWRTFGGSGDDDAHAILAGDDGSLLVALSHTGMFDMHGAMGVDGALVAVPESGAPSVLARITGPGNSYLRGATRSGAIVHLAGVSPTATFVFGSSSSSGSVRGDAGFVWTLELPRSSGAPRFFEGEDASNVVTALSVAVTTDGRTCVGGWFRGRFDPDGSGPHSAVSSMGDDGFVTCIDASGNRRGTVIAGLGSDIVYALAPTEGGDLYVGGRFSGMLAGRSAIDGQSAFVALLDSSLTVRSVLAFGGGIVTDMMGRPVGSTVYGLALTPTMVYAVGSLGPGSLGALHSAVDGPAVSGVDAVFVAIRRDMEAVAWAHRVDAGFFDVYLGVAVDGCGRVAAVGGGAADGADGTRFRPLWTVFAPTGSATTVLDPGSSLPRLYFRDVIARGRGVVAVGQHFEAGMLLDAYLPSPNGGSDVVLGFAE